VDTTVPDNALCIGCNYALRGLASNCCPECGRPFDADNPLTINLGKPLGQLSKTLLRPIGRWAHVCLWTLAATGILGPAWLLPSKIPAVTWLLLWGLFMTACCCRSTARYAVVKNRRQPRLCLRIDDPFRRRTRRVFLVVTLLVMTRAPFVAAMYISRPRLDPLAYHIWAVMPANVEPPQQPGMCGLVMVERVTAGPTHVTFHLFGGGRIEYRPTPDGERLMCRWTPWMSEIY
jgi:hypothetical protein